MNDIKILEKGGEADMVHGEAAPAPFDGPSAGWNDAAEFRAALEDGMAKNMNARSAYVGAAHSDMQSLLSKLGSVSSGIQHRAKAVDDALLKSSEKFDPHSMYLVSKELSALHLENSLAVKVIGKVTQAVEQLTKLQ